MGSVPVVHLSHARLAVDNAAPTRGSRRAVIGVHGSGAVAGTFVTDVAGYQTALDAAGDAAGPDWVGEHVRGSLCAYVRDGDSILVLPDPLGAGLVYVYDGPGGTVVSSDLGGLVATLGRLGRKPAKSLGFLAEFVVTTNGGWAHPASYQGVEVLAPFEYLRISRRDGVQRRTYAARARMYAPDVPYGQRLSAAAAEIRSNVTALATAAHDPKILHLTGGFDSRLVLAAVLEGGYAPRVSFLCTGRAGTADKRISAALASEFGLTMTDGMGARVDEQPRTLREQALWQIRYAHGMATVGPHHGYRPGRSLIGAGGYGETARSFYAHRALAGVRETAARFWGGPDGLFAPALVDRFHAGVQARLDAASALGVRDDARWDHAYLTGRNRWFVGEISRQWTPVAARFDPLYSLHAAALALSLPLGARHANVVGFDLMNMFLPALAQLPFESERYTPAYVELRGEPARREFAPGAPPPRRVVTYPSPRPPAGRESFPAPTAADRELAARLRITPAQAASIPRVRADLRELSARIRPAVLATMVDRRAYEALLNGRISARARFRALTGLRTALLWYTDDDGIANRWSGRLWHRRPAPARRPGGRQEHHA